MRKRLWVLSIPASLAIVVLAAACGGGGGTTATRTPTASATKTAAASSTRPAATATLSATRTPAAASPTRPAATATRAATAIPAATATPAAAALQISVTAQGTAFDKKTIDVTAGQPFTITLLNKDSMPHNLHIFTKKGGDSIAVTDPQAVQGGATGTLTATITQPGDYYFQCDFHATQMTGTLTVK